MIALLLAQALIAVDSPEAAGMSSSALKQTTGIIESSIRRGEIHAASILVARHGKIVLHRGFGRMSASAKADPVQADSVFLLASITKPVTACALMLLVERGEVSLSDPVSYYLPGFSGGERDKVLVRDLLAHTSGLPDMLPENTELRRAHAPLSEFVERTYKTPLLYSPGTSFRYQSMGVLLAGAIVEKITGVRLRDLQAIHLRSAGYAEQRAGTRQLADRTDGPGLDRSGCEPKRHRTLRAEQPVLAGHGTPLGWHAQHCE